LALGFIDWRLIWLILPVLAFTSFAPVIPALCQRTKYQDGPGRDGPVSDSAITQIDDSAPSDMPEIRRYQVKGDIIFWAVIIWLMMIPGFVITGLFFHQIHIAQLKEVPLWAWSANYIWYAIAAIGGAVLSGIMIDRFSAHKIASFVQIFLLVAIIMLYLAETPFWLAVFFVLFGASGGVMQPVINALLAERYGTRWLGEIKALASPLNVFSSALSPAVMGWMIDSGFGLDGLSVMLAAMAGINIIMPFIWFNLLDRTSFTPK
ncbi:MAG: MFS transporter, partial [Candidatus Puniceispirillaceae bacterium]